MSPKQRASPGQKNDPEFASPDRVGAKGEAEKRGSPIGAILTVSGEHGTPILSLVHVCALGTPQASNLALASPEIVPPSPH